MNIRNCYHLTVAVIITSSLFAMDQQIAVPQGVSEVCYREALRDPKFKQIEVCLKDQLSADKSMSSLLLQGIPQKTEAVAAVLAQKLNLEIVHFRLSPDLPRRMSFKNFGRTIQDLFDYAEECDKKCMIIIHMDFLTSKAILTSHDLAFWQATLVTLKVKAEMALLPHLTLNRVLVGIMDNRALLDTSVLMEFAKKFAVYKF